MDQVYVIRHKVLIEGQSIRSVARQMQVSRNTVRKYLHQSEPRRKPEGPREVVPVRVMRQAMITIHGTRYSVPCHWKCLTATAYVGAEDVRVVCGGETHQLTIEPDKKRVVRYRDYLSELARKPQAVRQVSSQLIAELGAPFDRIWTLIAARYSEREAARVLSRLLGILVEHGETTVVEMLHEALERGDLERLLWRPVTAARPTNAVPEALSGIQIEAAAASSYDTLFHEVGS